MGLNRAFTVLKHYYKLSRNENLINKICSIVIMMIFHQKIKCAIMSKFGS